MLNSDFRSRVLTLTECVSLRNSVRTSGGKVTLTNGCFDILHPGHLSYLQESASLGDTLIVAVNSDESVQRLKGPGRPVNNAQQRAESLAALRFVDAVFVFNGPRLSEEIRAISPDFYTKAGDYTINTLETSEREALQSVGTDIRFMPFSEGHSTTSFLARLTENVALATDRLSFSETLKQLGSVLTRSNSLAEDVEDCGRLIVQALKDGKKLLTCGNGGSAADALHLAEELVGRYRLNRRALPAICLNADTTALTCIANDFGYNQVFSRAVEAYGQQGDVLVGFTTSGNSPNVIEAFKAARQLGMTTILLSGNTGGAAKGTCSKEIIVPANDTARIQEVHTVILHQWLESIDGEYAGS